MLEDSRRAACCGAWPPEASKADVRSWQGCRTQTVRQVGLDEESGSSTEQELMNKLYCTGVALRDAVESFDS